MPCHALVPAMQEYLQLNSSACAAPCRAFLCVLTEAWCADQCVLCLGWLLHAVLCCVQSATEAACLILSVDETVKNPRSEVPDAAPMGGRGMGGRGMRGGRGRGMRR